jgi:hypothetical protein
MRGRRPCSGKNVPPASAVGAPARGDPARCSSSDPTSAPASGHATNDQRRHCTWSSRDAADQLGVFGKRNVCLRSVSNTRDLRPPPEPEPSLPRSTRPRRGDDVATGLREREQGWVLGPSLPVAWSSWIAGVQQHRLGRGTVRGVEADGPSVSHTCCPESVTGLVTPGWSTHSTLTTQPVSRRERTHPKARPAHRRHRRGGGAEQGTPGRHVLHKRSGRYAIARRLGQASRDRHPRSWED